MPAQSVHCSSARTGPAGKDNPPNPTYHLGMVITKHLKVSGRVQGVGYRYFMSRNAQELHVTGWVRNCRDGSVEAMLSGTAEAVHAMIERARRGPAHAMVSECRVNDAQGEFTGFDTLPTE